MGKQGQQFLAVLNPIPADGTVGESGDHERAIAADINGPDETGRRYLPELLPSAIEQEQPPVSPKREALTFGINGNTTRGFVSVQSQRLAVDGGVLLMLPICDGETRGGG